MSRLMFRYSMVLLRSVLLLLAAVTAAPSVGGAQQTFSPSLQALNALNTLNTLAAAGAASDAAAMPEADVRLLTARTATGVADTTVRLGLQFDLKPGWKVYWRSPGDAGYPPSIDWAGSQNLAEATISWPTPHRFKVLGIQTVGYSGQVVLPITARLSAPGEPLHLAGKVDYLICSEVCIPRQVDLAATLPGGTGEPTPEAHLIDRYVAQIPGQGRGVALETVRFADEGDRQRLQVSVTADPGLDAPDLFVEGSLGDGAGTGLITGPANVRLTHGGRRAVLTAPLLVSLDPSALPEVTLTVADRERGLEATATPVLSDTPLAGGLAGDGLTAILGIALLGGLILNLMPCVLPVLSLKAMGFVGHGYGQGGPGSGARRAVRIAFFASAAGIVASFLVLAGALAGMKAAGAAVGWGIQFQQPLFLVAMVTLLTLFAANLWGLFEVPMPSWLSNLGGSGDGRQSVAGHFATGAFATLLATPCSAPFLGTAVGFALARGPLEIGLIFLALGLGMALPYLLVAIAPGMARLLPRPGPWMIWFKRVLGFALVLTAVWLVWVLAVQMGPATALLVAVLMAALLAALALRRRAGQRIRPVVTGLAAVLALAAFVPAGIRLFIPVDPSAQQSTASLGWGVFDEQVISALVADGHVVFVDVTADWCITCKVNKAAVLERGSTAQALQAPDVVTMQADWTLPDPKIAAYLAGFGRYGIPFNVVYGPNAPNGIPLPELLTQAAVLEALTKAGGARLADAASSR